MLAAIVAAAGFLADHPGHVEIVWQDWQIDTSVAVLMAIFIAALLLLWGASRARRGCCGCRAAGGGAALTAAAGRASSRDPRPGRAGGRAMPCAPNAKPRARRGCCRRAAAAAARRRGGAAQGDRGWRGVLYRLLDRPETELLGLRGLLGEALESGDYAIARRFAERARQLQPASSWLAENVLALQARAGDWAAAAARSPTAARRARLPADGRGTGAASCCMS